MNRPNILLIVLDSARADRFSSYGYPKATSPNIDAIAEAGAVFERCQSEAPWTVPASVSMLTGLAPREHGAGEHRQLPEGMPSLQEALSARGYTTILAGANGFIGPVTGLDRGFQVVSNPLHVKNLSKPLTVFITRPMGWQDSWGGAITRRLIREVERARTPWFATIWYNETHHPYMGREPFSTRFAERPMSLARRWHLMSRMRHMNELAATADAEEWRDVHALYDGALAYNDHLIGQLQAALSALGAWENTIVVITGDHGDLLGEHGLAGHRWAVGLYREVTHVPLIVRLPGGELARTRSDALVQLGDIPHTLAAICGCSETLARTAAAPVDLREAATGSGREFAVSEREAIDPQRLAREKRKNPSFDYAPHMGAMALLNDGAWEYIRWETARDELFSADDRQQATNLIDERPEIAQRLSAALDDWQARVRPHSSTTGVALEEDEETRKRLEGLGYF